MRRGSARGDVVCGRRGHALRRVRARFSQAKRTDTPLLHLHVLSGDAGGTRAVPGSGSPRASGARPPQPGRTFRQRWAVRSQGRRTPAPSTVPARPGGHGAAHIHVHSCSRAGLRSGGRRTPPRASRRPARPPQGRAARGKASRPLWTAAEPARSAGSLVAVKTVIMKTSETKPALRTASLGRLFVSFMAGSPGLVSP